MSIKIKPENITEQKTPKSENGILTILIDCAIPIKKKGVDSYVYFKEGDIVEYIRIQRNKVKPCCGAEWKYYYVLKKRGLKLPVQLAKEYKAG